MQAQNYSIKDWAKTDRPREKLRSLGPSQLSDSELLAILLRAGTKNRSAVELARELLKLGNDNLSDLGRFSVSDFMKIRGVGEAKAITISAALELGRRRQSRLPPDHQIIRNSRETAAYIHPLIKDMVNEVFGVIFLNRGNRIKHHEVISIGGITGTVADPRIIFKKALAEGAVALILFHNHPSGNLKPSRADEELTEKIVGAARLFDIRILDHLIISDEGYFSFADEGMM